MATKPGDRVYQIISVRLDADTASALVHLRMGVVDSSGEVAYSPSTTEIDVSGPEATALLALVDAKLQADEASALHTAARLPPNAKKSLHQREAAFVERTKALKERKEQSRSERPLTPHPPHGGGNG